MRGKKTGARFTVQFRITDPAHRRVIELLNAQGPRGKAQYISDAVLYYENRDKSTVDEALIATVVERILRDRDELAAPAKMLEPLRRLGEDVQFDTAAETLDESSVRAIAGALEMFRGR